MEFGCMIFHRKLWHTVTGVPVWMTGDQKYRIQREVNLLYEWTWPLRLPLPACYELKSKVQLSHTSSTKAAEIPLLGAFWQQGAAWGALLNNSGALRSNFWVLSQATCAPLVGFPLEPIVRPWVSFSSQEAFVCWRMDKHIAHIVKWQKIQVWRTWTIQ